MVSTKGLRKGLVLAALYNASRPQGMGFFHFDPKPMTEAEADAWLKQGTNFDYLNGRVMKVNLKDDDGFEEWLYDRDNGTGAAQRAIDSVKTGKGTNSDAIQEQQARGTRAAAAEARTAMQQPTTISGGHVRLGMADMAPVVGPMVEQADKEAAKKLKK